ncbi:MFS transporter [Roseivivax sediminis]|uniref:MFS transporter, DHA1 family, arabinose polymer transporter n=1 Tax=Roseivivax sediminis TaxID=936889 RepID=A0A1I1UEH8_9RHOB|nr:MFS transporter [Roseivivax sediminis]SFD69025.1 MFS transporter, DHA1 family, arabinose polymer transporter [Roseivivax sediminis]
MSRDQTRYAATILSLALGAFAIGVSEFAAMGLLPYYAADLGVSEPVAGHAISGYALGVVIGAPVLAVLCARMRRRAVLAALILAFAFANVAGALAPEMNVLTGTRVIAGLPHGAYLGIAMLFAADLLPRGQRAKGVAQILMGLTLANMIGVPLASAIGQSLGWRSLFVIVAGLAVLSAILIVRVAPDPDPAEGASPLRELGALGNRAVWLTLAVGAVGFGGVFAVYSYFSAAMIDAAGAPGWAIPVSLSLFGVGATAGNFVASRLTAWSQMGGALVLLLGMVATALLYASVVGSWPLMALSVSLLAMTAGLVVPLQTRLMDVAGDAQTLAAALNHAAFNFANALGPFAAGLALSAGHGWASTGLVGAALSAGGIAVLGLAWMDARRRPGALVPA